MPPWPKSWRPFANKWFGLVEPFGFVNAFKPPGPSSTAFGAWVRRHFDKTPVGHWGTLDPAACGVLVLALGKAARLLPLIPNARKRYAFELVAGERTTTGDAAGTVLENATVPYDLEARLSDAVSGLIGEIEQTPPMHSAVKVNGRPLYKLARKGKEVSRPTRRVKIYELRLIGTSAASARFVVECDAGTYVRVLCEQIGARIGIPARMGALVRLAAGPFSLKDASLPREIARNPAACIIDPRSVIDLPQVELGANDATRFAHGNFVAVAPAQTTEVIAISAGRIIGTGRFLPERPGQLTPTRVLI